MERSLIIPLWDQGNVLVEGNDSVFCAHGLTMTRQRVFGHPYGVSPQNHRQLARSGATVRDMENKVPWIKQDGSSPYPGNVR